MEPCYDGRSSPPRLGSYGKIYFRWLGPFGGGYVHMGHRHYQDHLTILLRGSVRVRYRSKADGDVEKSAVFIAPYVFEVAAEVYHEITALEDDTVWACLFSNEDAGDIPFSDEVPENG